jgi:hypothetical protein
LNPRLDADIGWKDLFCDGFQLGEVQAETGVACPNVLQRGEIRFQAFLELAVFFTTGVFSGKGEGRTDLSY